MIFAAPFWLLGLAPWAAVSLYLLWGRRKKQPVPFLALWQGAVEQRRTTWAVQPPPAALVLALVAVLLGVLASARPVWRGGGGAGDAVTVVGDRGVTLSARGPDGKTRLADAARAVAPALLETFGAGPVQWVDVPGDPDGGGGPGRRMDRASWAQEVGALPPTALDTRARLAAAVAARLASGGGPLVVLTDRPAEIKALARTQAQRLRLLVVPPTSPWENVGLVSVAARPIPPPATAEPSIAPPPGRLQAMVRFRNDSRETQAVLVVRCGTASALRNVTLPRAGDVGEAFVDLPAAGAVVEVDLVAPDGLPADNRAWLVRERNWPKLEPRGALPVELVRLVESYRALQPAGDGSPALALVRSAADLPAGEPGVAIDAAASTAPGDGGAAVESRPHPVTENVRWQDLGPGRAAAPMPAGAGWQRVVWAGGQTLVAVRDDPARQVWVGFDAPPWARQVDYVVFWKNVFDWAGGGGDEYAGHPVARLGPQWTPRDAAGPPDGAPRPPAAPGLWPGLYGQGDSAAGGALRAVNLLDVIPPPPAARASSSPDEWRRQLAALGGAAPDARPAGPGLLLLAIACVLLSALTWRRRPGKAWGAAGTVFET